MLLVLLLLPGLATSSLMGAELLEEPRSWSEFWTGWFVQETGKESLKVAAKESLKGAAESLKVRAKQPLAKESSRGAAKFTAKESTKKSNDESRFVDFRTGAVYGGPAEEPSIPSDRSFPNDHSPFGYDAFDDAFDDSDFAPHFETPEEHPANRGFNEELPVPDDGNTETIEYLNQITDELDQLCALTRHQPRGERQAADAERSAMGVVLINGRLYPIEEARQDGFQPLPRPREPCYWRDPNEVIRQGRPTDLWEFLNQRGQSQFGQNFGRSDGHFWERRGSDGQHFDQREQSQFGRRSNGQHFHQSEQTQYGQNFGRSDGHFWERRGSDGQHFDQREQSQFGRRSNGQHFHQSFDQSEQAQYGQNFGPHLRQFGERRRQGGFSSRQDGFGQDAFGQNAFGAFDTFVDEVGQPEREFGNSQTGHSTFW